MKRTLSFLAFVAASLGCGTPQAAEPPASRTELAQAPPAAAPVTVAPPDLRTRKSGSDWPKFLGPAGTSVSDEKNLVAAWPDAGPPLVWRQALGEGYAAPTTSLGRLFQFTRFGDAATLLCLHAETGKELWRFEYPTSYVDQYGYDGGPRCSPIVDGDRVYLFGPEGMLHCVRAADGKVVWKVDTQRDFNVVQNFFGVGASPVVYGDLLIAMIGGSPAGDENKSFADVGSNGSGIVAFDKLTGRVVYKTANELASYASPVVASHAGRDWGFAFARGGLIAFDPKNGKIDFEFPWRAKILESVNAANPVVAGDLVMISECYGPGSAVLRFGPGKMEVVWEDDAKKREKRLKSHWCTPVAIDGHVYGCHGRHTNEAELRCLDLKTGEIKWSVPGVTRSSLTYVDGHFVCFGEYGQLRLFKADPAEYEEVSRAQLELDGGPLLRYPCWAAPVISHGYMYLRGEGSLVCLDLARKAAGPAPPPKSPASN